MHTEAYQQAKRRFIEFWGEMSSSWGISRTMSQVFALLFASPTPLDTDAIMEELDISRGNANMNLHKLMSWGLVRKVDMPESRKDFFVAEQDVWQMAVNIIRNRQEREIAPVQESLRQIADSVLPQAPGPHQQPRPLTPEEELFRRNLLNMGDFMMLFTAFSAMLLPILENHDPQQLQRLMDLAQGTD
jgi:DNA-binding transcriptional regulator GbsR (MarR family)